MGIYLDQADDFELLDTQVLLHGRDDAAGSSRISIGYGKTFSESAPQDAQFLVVRGNFVMGPGEEVAIDDLPDTGLETYWVCGRTAAPLRSIEISENWIEGWSAEGMEFTQSADIQVSCNKVVESRDGVDVDRDTMPPNVPIRFRENQVEVLTSTVTLFTFRTNDAANVKLGPDQADRGANRMTVDYQSPKLVVETDATLTDILDARDCFWFKDSSAVRTPLAEEDSITVRISSSDQTFDITGFAESDAEPECEAERPESAPSGMARSAGRSVQIADGPSASGAPVMDVPVKLELGRPVPNPTTGAMTVVLAVPADRTGGYAFEVFDVGVAACRCPASTSP